MTTIVGLVQQGVTYLAADSLASGDGTAITLRRPKIVRKMAGEKPLLIGVAGSYRAVQLVNAIEFPANQRPDSFDYVAIDLVEAIRLELQGKGAITKNQEEETAGIEVLIGYDGILYEIQSDFSVVCGSQDYYAVGSGSELAMGSLHTTQKLFFTRELSFIDPLHRLYVALLAAEEFDTGTRQPFLAMSHTSPEVLRMEMRLYHT